MTLLVIVYQIILTLLLPLGLLYWAAAALFKPRYRRGFKERLGLWPALPPADVWIHGASLGEVRAVMPLIEALADRGAPLLVTATSTTGRDEAAKILKGRGRALLLPVDHFLPLLNAFRKARPKVLVIAETELWPGLYYLAALKGVSIIIVSGRISDRTFPKYLKLRWLIRPLLNLAASIQARTPLDAERYIALGADVSRVTVGGNMKFDLPPPDSADPLAVALRRARAGGWRVLVLGSIHPGEAAALFKGAARLKASGIPLGLVAAPRHLERLKEIERELNDNFGEMVNFSELGKPLEASIIEAFKAGRAVMVDRVGLLSRLYGGAEAAFVGGSLVPVGGHNLLEPLRWGVPVLFGPYMTAAPDVTLEVLKRGLGTMTPNEEEFVRAAAAYFEDEGGRARIKKDAAEFFEANRGALITALNAVAAAGAR